MSNVFTGFAVFDLETTGISVGHHHRIIEIGVVRLDENLDIVEEWETLINPDRDIGAGDIHGLVASDLRDAPTFAQVAADIWHRFEGAVPVAHNFVFDRRFLLAEFSRLGIHLDPFDGLCTMRLAGDYGLAGGARKLTHLCCELSLPLLDSHSAGNDARMCASILRCVSRVADLASLAMPVSCPILWKQAASPLGLTRQKSREATFDSPLQTISHLLNSAALNVEPQAGKLDEYLLLLDRVLEDRIMDPEEAEELVAFAAACGISKDGLAHLHERYVSALASLVVRDGIVTDDERRDLCRVAGLLGVSGDLVNRR